MGLYDFLADAPAGSPLSYEGLQSRRKIAEALAAQQGRRGYPQTVGEGIASIGTSVADAMRMAKLDAQDKEFQDAAQKRTEDAYQNNRPPGAAGMLTSDADTGAGPPAAPSSRPPVDYPALAMNSAMTPHSVVDGPYPSSMDVGANGAPLPAPPVVAQGGDEAVTPPAPTPAQLQNGRDRLAQALLAGKTQAAPMPGFLPAPPAPAPAGGGAPLPFAGAGRPPIPASATDAGTPPVTVPDSMRAPARTYRADPYDQHQPLPKPPQLEPPGRQEWNALKMIASNPNDPYNVRRWQPIAEAWAAQRQKNFEIATDLYKKQVDDVIGSRKEERAAFRGQREADLKYDIEKGKLPQDRLPAPAGPDPLANTPQSRQRSGVPSLPPTPIGVSPDAWRAAQVPQLKADMETADKAEADVPQALDVLQQIRSHPGRDAAIGFFGSAMQGVRGTDAKGFAELVNQANGGAFLRAYQSLRGTGAISNPEGQKAEAAIARLSTAQNRRDFDKALDDFDIVMRRGLETAQRKVNRPVTAYRPPGDNTQTAPDVGSIGIWRGKPQEYIGGNPRMDSSYRPVQQ
jgi:hypothetical protein